MTDVKDEVTDEVADTSMERDESAEASGTGETGKGKKRRHLTGVDPSAILSEGRSKRRKTPTPEPEDKLGSKDHAQDPKDKERAKRLGMEIYNKIIAQKDREGGSMSEPFIKLPNKRSFPDYYETIPHPISLEIVHAKLQSSSYETLGAVTTDLGQIFWNAKRYNVKESLIFQYAKKLHKMTKGFYGSATTAAKIESDSEHEDEPMEPQGASMSRDLSGRGDTSMEVDDGDAGGLGAGPSGTSVDGDSTAGAGGGSGSTRRGLKRGSYMKDGPTVYKLVKPVLKIIKEAKAKDGSSRDISGIFMDLPSREELPDYYAAIAVPISLSEIESKMVARFYGTFEQFFDDLDLMCANAFTYNEDDSEVFRDAQQIKDIADGQRYSIRDRLIREEAMKARQQATPMRIGTGNLPQSLPQTYQQSPTPASNYQYNSASPIPQTQRPSYLPPLPRGIVNEDVVASLSRYPAAEQSQWVNSLPPLGMQMYRQIVTTNESRKRGSFTPSSAQGVTTNGGYGQLADPPSASRPGGISPLPNRQAPPLPTVKHLDFAFSTPDTPPERRQAIRLHNMRGVITHAVVLGSETTEVELSAYVVDTKSEEANGVKHESPEVSLKINGTIASVPKVLYDSSLNLTNGDARTPIGMKWTITVPSQKIDNKMEVVATKPGQATETTVIYMTKQ